MVCASLLLTVVAVLVAAAPVLVTAKGDRMKREYEGHGQVFKEFQSFFRAAQDSSANGEAKVNGLPPVMLKALSHRLGAVMPTSRIHRTGCVSSAEQLVGPAGRGTYELLLAPDTDGICTTPSLTDLYNDRGNGKVDGHGIPTFSSSMEWRDQSQTETLRRSSLPPVAEVFDAIFARKEGQTKNARPEDPKISFWMVSFVNWFHDDNFRTVPDTDGAFTWSDRGGLHMTQLYGHTEYRQLALRTMTGDGKMKTSSQLGWDFYPPLLTDIQKDFPDFEMWTSQKGSKHNSTGADQSETEADANLPFYFAIGDPRFNMHLGHILWTSIALYLHNTACDILLKENPFFTDEDIFQRARVMVFHMIQKIRLQDFVTDSIANSRDYVRLPYDPELLRTQFAPQFNFGGGHQPNFIEFNHVYQAWHSLIPNSLLMEDDQELPLRNTMWAPQLMSTYTIGEMATSFARTPLTQYGPHNFPSFLKGVTEAALHDERAQRMAPYNAYREFVGLDALVSFDQFSVKNPQLMAELYKHDIDSVEFLTGVLADSNPLLPGNFFGDVQLMIVALFALQDLSNNPMILNPMMSSSEYLTESGLQFVEDFEFRDILGMITGEFHPCPMQTLESPCIGPDAFKLPEEVGVRFMDYTRVGSYIGVDLTEWYYYENGYMRQALLASFMSMACIPTLYILAYLLFGYLFSSNSKQDDSLQHSESTVATNVDGSGRSRTTSALGSRNPLGRTMASPLAQTHKWHQDKSFGGLRISLCCLAVNTVISLVFFIPSTRVSAEFLTDPNWIQKYADSNYIVSLVAISAVQVHFAIEIVFRMMQSRGPQSSSMLLQLALHHAGTLVTGILAFVSGDVAIYKMGFTVLTAWTWEWPMFVSFLICRMYDASTREQELSERSKAYYRFFILYVAPVMILIFFGTRIIEGLVMGMLYSAVVERKATTGPVIAVIVLMSLAITLQFYAGYVFAVHWLRRRRKVSTTKEQDYGCQGSVSHESHDGSSRPTSEGFEIQEVEEADVSDVNVS